MLRNELFANAIQEIKDLGAEVFEIGKLENAEVDNNSFKVMLYEYKDGLNKYFQSLGNDAEIKTLEDLIEFNKSDSLELMYYNQKYLEMAQNMDDINSEDYNVVYRVKILKQ